MPRSNLNIFEPHWFLCDSYFSLVFHLIIKYTVRNVIDIFCFDDSKLTLTNWKWKEGLDK